ncbi:transposase [Streptomyces sp. NPDC058548]|uniref:transposase n=1 Tax=Streptomyces sp. NPDC058548 TaxID=3346545 RepID=UPI003650F209
MHPVHHRDGSDPGAPDRTRAPPHPTRSRPGRQGLQLESDPRPARRPQRSAVDRAVYKHRNVVERCFNHLKQWRGSATRYDKAAESYETAVALASLLMGVTLDDRT